MTVIEIAKTVIDALGFSELSPLDLSFNRPGVGSLRTPDSPRKRRVRDLTVALASANRIGYTVMAGEPPFRDAPPLALRSAHDRGRRDPRFKELNRALTHPVDRDEPVSLSEALADGWGD